MSEDRDLPKQWQLKKLSELIGDEGIFCDGDWVETKDQAKDGDVRLIQLADIGDGCFKDKSNRHLTFQRALELKCTFLTKGDILIARMPDPLGRSCIFPLDGKNKYVTVVDIAIIRVDNNIIDNKYLSHIINSLQIRKAINELESGTTRKRISRKNLNTIDFPIPPLRKQQAIVSKLEELLSDLENGKQQLQTALLQLKIYRQSLLKYAFEGRLTNPNVKPGELPTGWKWVKTKDVIEVINNGYTPHKEYLFEGMGEIPFIKVYNLNFDGTLNFKKNPTFIPNNIHKKHLKRSICYPGDVLTNIVGPPLGKVSIVPNQFPEWNINQAIVLFRPNANIISKFISYYLQNPLTINWLEDTSKATAGQWNIKVSTCREIPIPIPPMEEQMLIVNELESKLTVCEKLQETIAQSLLQSETLKQSILKKAFEGKLV
jgi:type I restriction enzyme S subunit